MIKAKKSLGQNFLIDDGVSRRIVEAVAPGRRDLIVEIGPGKGALTNLLIEKCGQLTAIEIDPRLFESLHREIHDPRLKVIVADALKLNWQEEIQSSMSEWRRFNPDIDGPRVRVVANLPYYISTPIIENLIEQGQQIFDLTLMLQEEVVDRIVSEPGSKAYGYFSVFVQYYNLAEKLFRVPPTAFQPVPKVWSAIVQLTRRDAPAVPVTNEAGFFSMVRAAFAQRRKTILNNLKAAFSSFKNDDEIKAALTGSNIDGIRRAETLTLSEFAELYRALFPE